MAKRKRISHGKAAADEAKKAALDAASIAIPELSKARNIIGTIYHGEKAAQHAKKAIKETIRAKTRKLRKAIEDPLKLKQPKRKARTRKKR
jgi:hypothetical protein